MSRAGQTAGRALPASTYCPSETDVAQTPIGWVVRPFVDCLVSNGEERKPSVQQNQYSAAGRFPVVDQWSGFIAGYTDDESLVHRHLPLILFGDHTRIFKFLDFPFASGADVLTTGQVRVNQLVGDWRSS